MTISGSLDWDNPIAKQSYLRIKIPGDFEITDKSRVASTCTRVNGFSDEISCAFEDSNIDYYLLVKGGFDSKTFDGTSFSFSIAEIQNPSTSKTTQTLEMEILDQYGALLYKAANEVYFMLSPSNFAYVHVESQSKEAGAASIYVVTITLGVETPQSTKLEFLPPSDIEF